MGAHATDGPEERLLSGHTGRMLGVLAIGWFAVRLGREAVPPLVPTIIDDLAISPAQAGFALTFMMGFYALLQFPGGRISDQLSRSVVLMASLGMVFAGFVTLTMVTGYPGFLLALGVVGAGAGLFFVPARALLSDLFVEKRGEAFGLQSAAGSLGATGAAFVAAVAVAYAAWQATFLPVLAVIVVVLVALYLLTEEPLEVRAVGLGVRGTFGRILRTGSIRWLLLAYMLFSFSWQGIMGMLPFYLQEGAGFAPTLASVSYAAIFVTAFFAGPIGGRLGDSFGKPRVALAGLTVAIVGLLGLLFVARSLASVPLTIASIVVMAIGLRSFPPVMQSHLMHLFPDDSMGGDFGGSKTIWSGFGSLGPAYIGVMVETVSLLAGFTSLILFVSVSAVIIAVHTWGRG